MKKILLYVVFLCIAVSAHCEQEIKVVSCKLNTTDISVRTNRRDDPTGKPCALVKVQFPKRDAYFLGDIIGSVAFKTNEYWIYMPQSSNQLEIHLEGYKPLVVNFNELETGTLESNQSTYELCLLAKEKDAPQMYDDGMVALAHKDMIKAFDYLTKAANSGYAPALYVMGTESIIPFDTTYDINPNGTDAYQDAFNYFKEGAEKGSADAQYALAKMLLDYNEGKKENHPWFSNLVKISVDEKMLEEDYIWSLLEKSADAGNTDAQWYMITKQKWCRNAAKKGVAIAEFGMGVWNDTSDGMNSAAYFHSWEDKLYLLEKAIEDVEEREQDAKKATEWYAKAANKGLDIAMWTLADKYQEGVGIEKNVDKALSLRKKVAENGNIYCQLYMAQSFRDGVMPEHFDDAGPGGPYVEIPEDLSVFNYWMRRVINHTESDLIQLERYAGCSMDMTSYDISYRLSEKGQTKDEIYWLQRAAEWGSEDAKEKLNQLSVSVPISLKDNDNKQIQVVAGQSQEISQNPIPKDEGKYTEAVEQYQKVKTFDNVDTATKAQSQQSFSLQDAVASQYADQLADEKTSAADKKEAYEKADKIYAELAEKYPDNAAYVANKRATLPFSLPIDQKEQIKLAAPHYATFAEIMSTKANRSADENKMLTAAYSTLLYYYVNCIKDINKGKEVAAKLLELDPENQGAKAVMGL